MPRAVHYGLLFLVFLAGIHIFTVNLLTEQHAELRKAGHQEQLFALPSPVLKIISLDYKGIVSDFLFIKGIVYLGEFVSQKGTGAERWHLNDTQWKAFYNAMDVSSDLDPYFQDPYYLANAFLTWDAGMIQEANALLDKGSRYRTWDWSLPFFSGFNYFYFLEDNDKAAEKIMEASRRPGASPLLASIASKMAFKAKKTESSIMFLEEMIKKTEDESTKKMFETRVEAYKAIFVLEKAVDTYRVKYKKAPADLNELLNKKIILEIPKEPYGGKFFIDRQGTVKTTSESFLVPHRKTQ